jgi:hypothetical protein
VPKGFNAGIAVAFDAFLNAIGESELLNVLIVMGRIHMNLGGIRRVRPKRGVFSVCMPVARLRAG